MAVGSEIGWYPNDPNFRKRFEEEIAGGLRHASKHGDLTRVQRLLELIPDNATRHAFAKSISTQFPIQFGKNGKPAFDKARSKDFDWSLLDTARFGPRRITVSDDKFFIRGEQFTAGELVDEVIDALVLHRHAIPDDAIRRLKEIVDAVVERRASKLAGTTPESECSGE